MADDLAGAMRVAASGLNAQSQRLRVVSENIANANSAGATPGADPYARKVVSFQSELDQLAGVDVVRIASINRSLEPFRVERDPSHPSADENGNVRLPNVNVLVELADLREANRSYEANLQIVKQVRDLVGMTIDLLRRSQ